MHDLVTIVGNVATDPTQGRTASGVPVTNFRLASTHRRFDDASQTWIDVSTNWYSVAAFRQLAEHAKVSLRSGDSVIVTGRMRIRAWENNGKQGTSVDIDADAIGHDLRWGTTAYRRTPRAAGAEPPRRTERSSPSAADPDPSALDSGHSDDVPEIETPWAHIDPSDSSSEPFADAHGLPTSVS